MKPLPTLDFGHPPALIAQWRRRMRAALRAGATTPFYLGANEPIEQALQELDGVRVGIPVRHWLSCKTQPAAPLLRWWRSQGRPIEVVSEFEFKAACAEGFAPESILVNGPAKHRWLAGVKMRGLGVNFDSIGELRALAPIAERLGWSVGLRLRTSGELDPENPDRPTQFGLEPAEFVEEVRRLRRRRIEPETLSFHLRTNVAAPDIYERAVGEAAGICAASGFQPRQLDCGGGLPPPHVLTRGGKRYDQGMSLSGLSTIYRRSLKAFTALRELWLENGRFVSARSGVLAVRVLESKRKNGLRQLICDGGRTMNALISTWEHHAILPLADRKGPTEPTILHGPTCMAFDQLGVRDLPSSTRVGDIFLWMDAGAYHLPWETHFSHGLAAVWWDDGEVVRLERPAESFEDYWGRWQR